MGDSEHNTSGISKQQLPLNLVGNFCYFIVHVAVGLLLVPFFISSLGIAAYGIIPLAVSLNGYVGILTQSLNIAVTRYLTVDLQSQNYIRANKTFNTAFFGITGIIILMIPVIAIISFLAPTIFNVPSGQETESVFLFLGVTSSFLIRTWSSNFTVSLFAYNRLDLMNLIEIINVIVQVFLIVSLFLLKGPSLAFVGLAYLISGVVALVLAIILSKRINPYLKIDISQFNRSRLVELFRMGWWVVVNQIGALFFHQFDLIVVNVLFGATVSGEYAIAVQWVILLRAIAGVLAGVLTPVILIYYANKQIESLIEVSKSAVKIMGLAMSLPIGLICGFAPQLLTIWIGSEYVDIAPLMVILTITLSINLSVLPLFSINVAYNKVKIPGIVTFLMGVGKVGLIVWLPLITGWGLYGVAMGSVIALTLKNVLFTPWYATKILGLPKFTFIKSIFPGVISTLGVIGATFVSSFVFRMSVIPLLIISGLAISCGYLIVLWLLGFNKFERDLFLSFLPKQIRGIFE